MSELSANAILYMPEAAPYAGVIQIIHGMAEHQGRYRELAQFFTEHGYVVLTSDLRGHGNHIARDVDLGYFGDNALSRLVSDIHDNTGYIREQFPNLPYILFGHGIGALLAVTYAKKYDRFLDGLFLSGMPADRLLPRRVMNLILMVLMVLRGEYTRSSFVNYLIMGQYYRPLIREGSEFSWLSADPENVRKYQEDPKCGYIYTFNGFKTVLELMNQTYTKGSWSLRRPDLPIRLFWGAKDPCMSDPNDLSKTVHLFSDHGYQNVAYISYPEQRHEVFQDYDKERVFLDTLKELETIRRKKDGVVSGTHEKSKHIILEDFIDPEVDRPLVKDEKLDLKKLVHAHEDKIRASGDSPVKVEMVDFSEIEQTSADEASETDARPASRDYDALIDELLNNETYIPGGKRPLDDFDGFKIDPDIMDGIH